MQIRPERAADHAAVRALHAAAFETPAEAALVDRLRREASPLVSIVAVETDAAAGGLVGHILFSPVELTGAPGVRIMGLAPMAVMPARQREGIGAALVRSGLDACRALGQHAVVVLGHSAYYPRFGFEPAARFMLHCEYDVPAGAFMALELESGSLDGHAGLVRYHPAFAGV